LINSNFDFLCTKKVPKNGKKNIKTIYSSIAEQNQMNCRNKNCRTSQQSPSNPRNESFDHRSPSRIHKTNFMNTRGICDLPNLDLQNKSKFLRISNMTPAILIAINSFHK